MLDQPALEMKDPLESRTRSATPNDLITRLITKDTVVLRPLPQDQPPENRDRKSSERYQLYDEIARGGIGVVLNGRDGDLGRGIAIKVLQQQHRQDPTIVQRFIEEAQIAGQLQHPGIVPVYDMGLYDNCPFFAMKLIRGRTLQNILRKRTNWRDDLPRILNVFEAVCQTVAYAHARGVVHRDLKPDNVMVGEFGEVQVVDWGIAKVLERSSTTAIDDQPLQASTTSGEPCPRREVDPGKSVDGDIMGTPAYMSPEQARGEVELVDERSDVFGLGAILCEILTTAPPFEGNPIVAAMSNMRPVHSRLIRSGADDELAQIAIECLAEEQGQRPGNAKLVAQRIAAYRANVERRARNSLLKAAEARGRARATIWVAIAVVVAITALLGGGLYVYLEAQRRQRIADERVDTVLDEAAAASHSARATNGERMDLWEDAVEIASRAVDAAAAEDVSESRRLRARAEYGFVFGERNVVAAIVERRAKENAMLVRLDTARIPTSERFAGGGWSRREARRLARRMREAFLDYCQLDPRRTDPKVAAKTMQGEIAVQLATALDLWALAIAEIARHPSPRQTEHIENLRAIAQELDPNDSWRSNLRTMLRDGLATRSVLEDLATGASDETLAPESAQLLAESLLVMGAWDSAMSVYRRALSEHPTEFGTCFRVGILSAVRGDWPASISYLRVARGLRPDMLAPSHMLGIALTKGNRAREARELLQLLIRDHSDNRHLRYHLAEAEVALENYANARAILEAMLAYNREEPNVLTLLAHVIDRTEGPLAALPWFEKVVRLQPRDSLARGNLGIALRQLERLPAALRQFRAAVRLAPGDAKIALDATVTMMRMKKIAEAHALLSRSIELCAPNPILHVRMAEVLIEQGQLDAAEAEYEQAHKLGWPQARLHYGRALILRARGNPREAIAELRRGLRAKGAHDKIDLLLVSLLLEVGETEAALAHAQVVVVSPTTTAASLRRLGAHLTDRGHPVMGERAFRRMLDIGSPPARSYYLLGNALLGQSRLAESCDAFTTALDFNPRLLEARCNLAVVLRRRERYVEALGVTDDLLKHEPDLLFARDLRIQCLLAVGKIDEARRTLAEAEALVGQAAKDPNGVPVVDFARRREQIAAMPSHLPALRSFVLERSNDLEGGSVLEAAAMARRMARYERAVQLFEIGFGSHPPSPSDAVLAARSALLAQETPEMDDSSRGRLRSLALTWLERAIGNDPERARWLRSLLPCGDFDSVRKGRLAAVSRQERGSWRSLWNLVDRLSAR